MMAMAVHQDWTGHDGLVDRDGVNNRDGLVNRNGLVLDDRGVDYRFHDRSVHYVVVPGKGLRKHC